MIVGLWAVAGLALGSGDASTVQRLHELEWERAEVVFVAPQIAGGEAATRAEGARTLGRLRDEQALPHLVALQDDPEEQVRRAVAEALAFTPGSADAIRAWLEREPLPSGLAARAHEAWGVVVLLVEALGHQGSARDLATLEAMLDEPWPVGAAAARALGRLGVRREAGAAGAVPALADRLDAGDPRIVDAVAWALSRVGMAGAADADVARVRARLSKRTTPQARAWLIKASWPVLAPSARDELLLTASVDPSRLPRVAILDALQAGDVPADVVSTWLAAPDLWVRIAAIRALGRDGSPDAHEALSRHAREVDPGEAAEALAARGTPDPEALGDLQTPPALRAVLAGLVEEPGELQRLALDDEYPGVRSAASAALMEDEEVSGLVGVELLAATDPAVREVALELIDRLPVRDRVSALLAQVRIERDELLVHSLLGKLSAIHAEDGRAIDPRDKYVEVGLRRGAAARAPATRKLALELAQALGLEPPEVPDPEKRSRELFLPGGERVEVEGGWPTVAETRRIRGARVETTDGVVQLQLDPDIAPHAVANFAKLARTGFFDGQVVHRVEPAFVVQTGCPRGDGWGSPGWSIPDEVSLSSFERGALGMARASEYDTGGSQWFVTTAPQPHLDGRYTRFGHVVQGMHVLDRTGEGARILSVQIEQVGP